MFGIMICVIFLKEVYAYQGLIYLIKDTLK